MAVLFRPVPLPLPPVWQNVWWLPLHLQWWVLCHSRVASTRWAYFFLYSLANPVSDTLDIRLLWKTLKKLRKLEIVVLYCVHAQFGGCGNRFLEEGLFVLGYFWHEDKAQSRVGKDWPPIFLSFVLDYFKEVVGSLHQLVRLHWPGHTWLQTS